SVEPVPSCDRIERIEERIVMHALAAERPRPAAVGGIEQRNGVRIEQHARRVERHDETRRAMDLETALLRVAPTDEEAAPGRGALCEAIHPRDGMRPVATL